MHPSVMNYITYWANATGDKDRLVLDVGSYDVNGSPRNHFTRYIGVDIRRGPSVDSVAESQHLPFASRTFDLIICSEMLEHDAYPWLTMTSMTWVLKSKGYIILTARGYDESGCTPIHDYPHDYWRYSPGAIESLARWAGLSVVNIEPDTGGMPGVLSVLQRS